MPRKIVAGKGPGAESHFERNKASMMGNDKRAVFAAFGAAILFGAGTPSAKWVLGQADPWLVAGLLYLGSGIGLLAYRLVTRHPRAALQRSERKWLAASIGAGAGSAVMLLTRVPGGRAG